MSTHLTIGVDLDDPTPPYEQLRRQLTLLIETGQLPAGERLPTLRHLARDLGLAVGTVNRAYRELESVGLIRTSRGGGTRVEARPRPDARQREAQLRDLASTYAVAAATLGVTEEAAAAALYAAWPATPSREATGSRGGRPLREVRSGRSWP